MRRSRRVKNNIEVGRKRGGKIEGVQELSRNGSGRVSMPIPAIQTPTA